VKITVFQEGVAKKEINERIHIESVTGKIVKNMEKVCI